MQHAGSPRSRRAPRRILIAATALIAGVVLAWYVWTARPRNRLQTPTLTVVPVTSFAGYKDFGSLSPDGRRIAFSWNGGRGGSGGKLERNIYTKTIGPDDPVRLTFAAEDDTLPAWSPDGRYIAFCRTLAPDTTVDRYVYAIDVVPASGGQERKVAEGGKGVSWAPDGKTLAMAGLAAEGGIFLLSFETGKRSQLTSPHPYFDDLPVFSPDGRWIAFTRDFGFSAREIFVVPAHGGAASQLTFDREPTYGAAWTADSREIVFASNRGIGGESLWRMTQRVALPHGSQQHRRAASTRPFRGKATASYTPNHSRIRISMLTTAQALRAHRLPGASTGRRG
jgi:Tol biopolymer transport system component